MFDPPEALLNNILSKSDYLIHELFPTNLLLFQEPVSFGTLYLPLPFLNPTTYLASNLISTNWISSPYLLNFPFSFFLCQGFVIGSIGISLTFLTKRKISRVPTSGYIFQFTFRSLSDVSYSDECRTKRASQYANRMFPLFRAIVKFCSTNRLLAKE